MILISSILAWMLGFSLCSLSQNFASAVPLGLLGLGLIVLIAAALRCNSWPDVFFLSAIVGFVWLPLCYLTFRPEVFSYIGGQFQFQYVSNESVLRGARLVALIALGWTIGRIAFGGQNFSSLASLQRTVASQTIVALAWFAVSVSVQAIMTVTAGFGVAGTAAQPGFAGYFYYLLPADALALLFAALVGGRMLDRNLIVVATAVLFFYLSMKLYQGWKGAFVQVAIAFSLFAVARAGWTVRVTVIAVGLLIVVSYGALLKPVTNILRIMNVADVSWDVAATRYWDQQAVSAGTSAIQTRLTEGTINGLVAFQEVVNWEVQIGGLPKLAQDILEGIVPGDVFRERSFSRRFTEDVLGQPVGMESTFAPGILATAHAIHPMWGGMILGLILAVAISTMAFIERRTACVPLSVFITVATSVLCVEVVTEGASGRLEQVAVWSLVLFTGIALGERLLGTLRGFKAKFAYSLATRNVRL